MGTAIKTGFMNYQKRDALTTTFTTAKDFITEVYLPLYNSNKNQHLVSSMYDFV
ncbi:hypothetical protein [Pedobacter sp. R-06]|uniref:hypothetical protein n=1 Tax=Pedobacter sp. R-06 TaxID=3404051 RepID=UPI003CEF13BC